MSATAVARPWWGGSAARLPWFLVGGAGAAAAIAIERDAGAGQAALFALAALVLGWIADHDRATLRAPNVVVLPALATMLAGVGAVAPHSVVDAAVGGVMAFVFMAIIVEAGRGRMGHGDTKVAALCGMVTGAGLVLPLFFITFAVGGVVAIACLALGRRQRKDVIAFTPFLVVGVLITTAIWGGYIFV